MRRGPALWRVAAGAVVVAAVDGRTVTASGAAVAIWQCLPAQRQPPIPVSTLMERLATDHGVPPATVHDDTLRVLEAWEAIGCAVLDA